jgi:hypothetical protein
MIKSKGYPLAPFPATPEGFISVASVGSMSLSPKEGYTATKDTLLLLQPRRFASFTNLEFRLLSSPTPPES